MDALTFEDFLDARAEWNAALQRSNDNHIFETWEWLSIWWRHYGDERRFILVTVNDGKKMLAAAPMMSSNYKLFGLRLAKIEFIATPASDYHTFLLSERKRECAKMLIAHAADTAAEWDCIELQEIPDDSETAKTLRTISKEPFKFEERAQDRCPYVFLPDKFEGYLAKLGPSFRKNLHRYERKLRKEYRVDFVICNDIETVDNAMKAFFDLHQKRWQSKKQAGAFSDQRFHDFHLDVARSFAERGWLTLDLLMLDDEPVAAGYNFKYGKKLFYYLSGFDPQYSGYNVGHLRHMYLIKHCIEQGLEEYDFMRGDEPYKLKWSASLRRNLQVRTMKRGIIPIFYDWITRNERLYPLTSELGKHLSVS